jgi:hypothetical protein
MNPESDTWRFKWDFKTPFRDTPYAIRRKRPNQSIDTFIYTNLTIPKEEIEEQLKLTPAFKGYYF